MNCALLCFLLALAELVAGHDTMRIVVSSGVSMHGEAPTALTLRLTLTDGLEVALESGPDVGAAAAETGRGPCTT